MALPVLLPLTSEERLATFQLVHDLTNTEWLITQLWMKDILDFTPDCRDSFREAVCNTGQAIIYYILLKLKTNFTKEIAIKKSSKTVYRYVWLEIDGKRIHVQSKGSMWYKTQNDCLAKGLTYNPSFDLPETEWQPHFILSLETQCLCQRLHCPFSDDIYARPPCRCIPNDDAMNIFNSPPVQAGSISTPRKTCRLMNNNKYVNIIRLSWIVTDYTTNTTLNVFVIPRSDTYFYCRTSDITSALNEYICSL